MSAVGQEIVDFLLPKFDDPLQVGFLVIILLMMTYTVVSTHVAARKKSWEKKWSRGTASTDDDLDIEHGSVTDLWHAVATSSEKLAEIMPGLLLVVGLLGTFLGLGMALNHASSILGQADAVADSMGDLLGLLKGLGTKFKTSTWGIMGFVALKIWSEVFRFEEKRLTWVIDKVKGELKARNERQQKAEEAKQQVLINQIRSAASAIVEGVASAVAGAANANAEALEKGFGSVGAALQDVRAEAASTADAVSSSNKLTLTALEAGFNSVGASLQDVRTDAKSNATAIAASAKLTTTALEAGFSSVGASLQDVRAETKSNATAIEASAKATKSGMETGFNSVCDSLRDVHSETKLTSAAMSDFTNSTTSIVKQMAVAADGMAGGADKISVAAASLDKVVGDFGVKFTRVLDDVGDKLHSTISEMSAQSSATLKEGSAKLESATKEISGALAVLSDDVKGTMKEVQVSISKALDIQRRSSEEFTVSMKTLNDQIETTTITTGTLVEPIKSGLSAISTANQQMRGVANSLTKQVPVLEQIATELERINAINVADNDGDSNLVADQGEAVVALESVI